MSLHRNNLECLPLHANSALTASPRGGRRLTLGLAFLAALLGMLSPAALHADEPESSAEVEQRMNELIESTGDRAMTDAETAELIDLADRYDKALQREAEAANEPSPAQPRGRSTAKPRPTPAPPVDRSPRPRSRTGKPTPAPTPAPARPRGGTTSDRGRTGQRPEPTPPPVSPEEEEVEVPESVNLDQPYDQRWYTFSIVDGTYRQLIQSFSRMSGLPWMGLTPAGQVTFVSDEELNFKAALGRVQMLLFNHPEQFWMTFDEKEKVLRVKRMTDIPRELGLEKMFPTLQEYRAADLDENDLALLMYTPETGSIAEIEPLRDYLPDYVRTQQYADENALTVFALVKDINKFLALIDKFRVVSGDPRKWEMIHIDHLQPSEALEKIQAFIDFGGDSAGAAKPGRRARTSPAGVTAEAYGVDADADDVRHTLLVHAMPKKIEEIKEFLKFIDLPESSSARTPEIVRVEHADAGAVMELVKSMLTDNAASGNTAASAAARRKRAAAARRSNARKKGAEQTAAAPLSTEGLTMIHWPTTNSIVLQGEPDDVAEAKGYIALFDVSEDVETSIVALTHRSAEELISLVTELLDVAMPGATDNLHLSAQANDTRLIISGAPRIVAEAEKIIATLDTDEGYTPDEINTITLECVKPSSLITILTTWDAANEPSAAPATGAARKGSRRTTRSRTTASGKFVADDAANQLRVICTTEEWNDTYQPMIERLDREGCGEQTYNVVALTHIAASEAMQTLQTFFSASAGNPKGATGPTYVPVPEGLLVTGATPSELATMKKLIAQIDVDPFASGELEQRTFKLEYAEPGDIIPVIESLINNNNGAAAAAAPARGKRRARTAAAAPASSVNFVEYGQQVWVTAPPKDMARIAELIVELDVPTTVDRELRVYEFAIGTDVAEVANTMRQLFAAQGRVAAPAAGAKGNARARNRAAAARRAATAAPTGDDILFIPQQASRKLLISAPVDLFPEIEEVLETVRPQIDERAKVQWKFFDVTKSDPQAVAGIIQPLLEIRLEELVADGVLPQPDPKKPGGDLLRLIPDAGSGRLLVAAPSALIEEVAGLIEQIEAGDVAIETRIVELTNTSATEMAETVQAMIAGRGSSTRRAPVASNRRGGRGRRGQAQPAAAASPTLVSTGAVAVVPMPGDGKLLLRGPKNDLDEIEALIAQIDGDSEPGTQMKIYELSPMIDIEDLADTIMTVFDSGGGAPKKSGASDFDDFMDFGGPRRGQDIRLTTNYYTNTMVVWASPRKLAEIDQYIDELETSPTLRGTGEDIPSDIYKLKYADAFDAKYDLEEYIDAIWGSNKPKVDYVPFSNNLIIKSRNLEEDFPRLAKIIEEHIDTPDKGPKPVVEKKSISGVSAQDVVLQLLRQLPSNIDIEVEGIEPDNEKAKSRSIEPDSKLERSLAPCVLPSPLTEALDALTAAALAQAKPADQAEDAAPQETGEEDPAPAQEPTPAAEDAKPAPTAVDRALEDALRRRAEDGQRAPAAVDVSTVSPADIARLLSESKVTDDGSARQKIKIRVDRLSNTIYIEGMSGPVSEIKDKIDTIEEETKDGSGVPDIQVWKLEHIDPSVAAQVLEAMFNAASRNAQAQAAAAARAQARAAAQQRANAARKNQANQPNQPQSPDAEDGKEGRGRGRGREEENQEAPQTPNVQPSIEVFPYPPLRAIILKAPAELYPQIERLVGIIDQPTPSGNEFRFFQIENQAASDVEEQLKLIFGLQDQAAGGRSRTVARGRAAGNAAAEQAVQNMMDQQLDLAGLDIEGAVDPSAKITITSNDISNTLLVKGPPAVLELAAQIIAEIEKNAPPPMQVKTYPLKYSDASEAVDQLRKLFEMKIGGGTRSGGGQHPEDVNAVFLADTANNAVVVRAVASDFPQIEGAIALIDVQSSPEEKALTVELSCGEAAKMAKLLDSIYGIGRSGRNSAKRVEFTGDDASNTVVFVAPPDLRDEIKAKIKSLDESACGLRQAKFIALSVASPSTVAAIVEETFGDNGRGNKSRISVKGVDTTRQLVVTCPEEMFPQIEAFAKSLDVPPDTDIKVFKLKHARANDVLSQLERMVRSVMQQLKSKKIELDVFSASADERSNALIVMGGSTTFALVEKVLSEIDVETGVDTRIETMVIALVKTEARDVAANISRLFGGRQADGTEPPRAEANADTNTLIIRGTRAQLDQINNEVIKKLEEFAPNVEERVAKVYNIRYADINGVRGAISTSFRQERGESDAERVDVAVDASTRTVVVTAKPSKHEKIAALVESMDTDTGGLLQRFTYRLENGRASEVASLVTRSINETRRGRQGPPVSVLPTDDLNMLVITSTQQDYDEILPLIKELDQEPKTGARDTAVYTIKYADPNGVNNAIRNAFRAARGTADIDRVDSSVEWATQSVIVTANAKNQEAVAGLIAQLDQEPKGGRVRYTYTMKKARASEVQRLVSQTLQETRSRSRTGKMPVSVVANDELNMLIVSGTQEEIDDILPLIEKLDEAPITASRATKVYTIKYADPNGVNNAIRNAYRATRGTADEDRVDSSVEWATQSVIVTANEKNQEDVAGLIAELDQERGIGERIRQTYQMKNARASEVQRIVSQTLNETRSRSRTGRMPVSVVANDELNMLIVNGTKEEIDDILPLIEKLDQPSLEQGLLVQVYPVKYADPSSLIGTINNSFPRTRSSGPEDIVRASYTWGTSSLVVSASEKNHEKVAKILADVDVESSTQRDTHVLTLKEANAEDLARQLADIMRRTQRRRRDDQGMAVVADRGTNSLLVYANSEELEQVRGLIETLDVPPSFTPEIKSFKLTYAEAWPIREAIVELFGRQAGRQATPRDQVSVVVDWGSNSLVVSAAPAKMAEVEAFIQQIDQSGQGGREVHVVTLKEADAQGMVRSLQDMFVKRGTRGQETVSITSPQGSDALLIKANDKEFAEISAVIETLDGVTADGERTARMFILKYTNADEMQTIIEDYMTRPGSSGRNRNRRGGGSDLIGDIRITTIPSNNSIVATGTADGIERVAALIADIDVEVEDAGNAPKIIHLTKAIPSEVEPTLTQIFVDGASSGRGGRGRSGNTSAMTPVIVANDASSTLIVRASPADYNLIERLALTLDQQETDLATNFRIVRVQPAFRAADLALTVEQAVQAAQATSRPDRSRGRGRGSSGGTFSVTAIEQSNTLVMAGDPKQLGLAVTMVDQIQTMGPQGGMGTIMLEPVNIDPEEYKRVVEEMLGNNKSQGSTNRRNTGRGRRR